MQRRRIAIASIVLAAVALAGLYAGLQALKDTDHDSAGAKTFHLSVVAPRPEDQSRPLEDFPIFKAKQGDTITLIAHSETPGSVHVHVYEKEIPLVPGGDAELTFVADISGRFPVHLHEDNGTMHHLATIEVQPR